jgi:cytosine/adenosine deaminase-related metal-dependent hydrolase
MSEPAEPADRADFLVRAGHVLTLGPAGDLADGAVAVAGDRIAAVGPYRELRARYPGAPVVGDAYGVLTPGLVNAHTHFSESLLSGMGEDLSIWVWGARLLLPTMPHLTREMARVGTLFRGAELIRSGVTTVNDMFCHTNPAEFASLGVVDGLEELGLRGVVSFGAEDMAWKASTPLSIPRVLDEHRALARRAGATRRVGFRVGVGTILAQSDALLEQSAALARVEGWGVHTHLAEVREEKTEAQLRWGRSTVERAAEAGLLAAGCVAGHGVWLSPAEMDLLAAAGTAIIYNPTANMILASGVCPLPELARRGLPLALGTDGMASNDSQNMIEVLKLGALLQKVHRQDPTAADARQMLALATIGGARALGLAAVTGSLEPGKQADLVRFDGASFGAAVMHDPYQQLVHGAGPESVADVWVDGAPLLRDGAFVSAAPRALVPRVRELAAELARKGSLSSLSCLAR